MQCQKWKIARSKKVANFHQNVLITSIFFSVIFVLFRFLWIKWYTVIDFNSAARTISTSIYPLWRGEWDIIRIECCHFFSFRKIKIIVTRSISLPLKYYYLALKLIGEWFCFYVYQGLRSRGRKEYFLFMKLLKKKWKTFTDSFLSER